MPRDCAATVRLTGIITVASLLAGAELAPPQNSIERINLEAHGSVSFGYLRTWGNDWTGDGEGGSSEEGTTDFWEAAANVIARPVDRLRLGAQLFARDLGRYDNGTVVLDWAYADYRFTDSFGVQLGRYKIPLGLYNETADIDAARTAVFLPPNIYSFRARDLYVSADGLKVSGLLTSGIGSFEYVVHGGAKHVADDSGFAAFLTETSGADPGSVHVEADGVVGASLHWHTPLDGLGLRVSFGDLIGFQLESTTGGIPSTTSADHYTQGIFSLLWEQGDWEIASEYSRIYTRGEITVDGVGQVGELRDNSHSAHLSFTWHTRPWLDLHASLQMARREAAEFDGVRADTVVLAARVLPLPHWSLKVEGRQTWGVQGLTPQPDGAPAEDTWQALALKSTWDF